MPKPYTSEKIRAFMSISHLILSGDVDSGCGTDWFPSQQILIKKEGVGG